MTCICGAAAAAGGNPDKSAAARTDQGPIAPTQIQIQYHINTKLTFLLNMENITMQVPEQIRAQLLPHK